MRRRRVELAGLTPARTSWPERAAFTSPKEAIAALADLDPREAVAIELVYPGLKGDRVETVLVEVGDFAAGRAFVLAAKR